MSRLSKLYEAMETLRKEGLPVNEDLEKKANELEEDIIKKELEITDPDFYVELHQDECDVCITSKDSETMISIMYLCQNGMLEMSPVIDHLPVLSLNMGVIRTHDHSLTIDYSLRSPVKSLRDELCMQLETIAYLYGASVQVSNEYPGWDYDPHSRLRAQF